MAVGEQSKGEWEGGRQGRGWLVCCAIWGGWGELFEFHSLLELAAANEESFLEGLTLR